ncbi:zinc finger protein 22-like [Culex pipiens pallens]|uniref:zinc finger protein 22-like n=1 Tax=Culex pipiens pallens TaxID=42434 RepID=UPI001953F398|nr:zinc finger protein 22-like [Culex pipiens pallens]
MAQLQQSALKSELKAHSQCRLCMNLAGEFCSFTNFIEDTRTVQDVIKMLLALEDDPFLPQQICIECSKELLHVARIKELWATNQFALARQAASLAAASIEKWPDAVKFPDPVEGHQMFVQVDENVSESELFVDRADLEETQLEDGEEFDRSAEQEAEEKVPRKKKKKRRSTCKKEIGKFRCFKCNITFDTIEQKNEHARQHFKCKFCVANFLQMNDLRRHLRKHTNERPYTCPHCTQAFQRLEHVNSHVKQIHSGPGCHSCTMCAQQYSTEEDLMEHRNSSHPLPIRPSVKQEKRSTKPAAPSEPPIRASFIKEEPMVDFSANNDD